MNRPESGPGGPGAEERTRIVILISGSGSNMLAIAEQVANKSPDADIAAVISNVPDVAGLQKARDRDIHTAVVNHKEFATREEFDVALMREIDAYQPDLVVLAGFMRILTADFVRRYEGRMINIHPSLLPKYQGLNTHQRALDAGDSSHGVTVHFVTEVLDDGPNIIQATVAIEENDDADTLRQKVQTQEHIIYPIAVKWFVEGRLKMDQGKAWLDNVALPGSGLQLES